MRSVAAFAHRARRVLRMHLEEGDLQPWRGSESFCSCTHSPKPPYPPPRLVSQMVAGSVVADTFWMIVKISPCLAPALARMIPPHVLRVSGSAAWVLMHHRSARMCRHSQESRRTHLFHYWFSLPIAEIMCVCAENTAVFQADVFFQRAMCCQYLHSV